MLARSWGTLLLCNVTRGSTRSCAIRLRRVTMHTQEQDHFRLGDAERVTKQVHLGGSRQSAYELLSQYDFVLCSSPEQLRKALDLRLEVFHQEQGFPKDTEVDEYDPISAHFLLTRRSDGEAIGVVRLTPYPRKTGKSNDAAGEGNVSQADKDIDRMDASGTVGQDETSMAQSGGGPQGTSGGLPMYSSVAPETKTKGTPAETASDAVTRKEMPLGRPLPLDQLTASFADRITNAKSHPFREAADAPVIRGAKLSRLAASKSERGKGCGALLVRQSEAWLMGVMSKLESSSVASIKEPLGIVLSSQMPVVGFYEALGYTRVGEPYDEEGAPHTWCLKQLARVEK